MTTEAKETSTPSLVVTAPDGRRVAADMHGPDGAPVVLLLHPAPGSRHLDPDPQATARAGVRLVTVDRPGCGGSDPEPSRLILSVADAADDAALVLDELGITEAAFVGWSAGGRVAVALAARRPDLARCVAVIATPAPHDQVPWIPEDLVALTAALGADPDGAIASLEQMLAPMAADAAAAVEQVAVGPADEQLLARRDDVRAALVEMLAEAYRQGAAGLAADIASYTLRDWGFDPRAVGAPLRAWYGDADLVVSTEHGRWWVDQVADGELTTIADVGHLVVVPAWADVLDWARRQS